MIRRNRTNGLCRSCWPVWHSLSIVVVPVAAAILAGQGSANASDSSDVEVRVKAAYIYNFARFVEWPARPGAGPLRIGILGKGDLERPLQEVIRGKTANGRSLEVSRVSAVTEADCCEILVIERSESRNVKDVAKALTGKPVLTVCDEENCFRDGAMIAFLIVDESVRFQINQDAAAHAGLTISSQLLKVAVSGPGKRR